jgi:hypothetical protein
MRLQDVSECQRTRSLKPQVLNGAFAGICWLRCHPKQAGRHRFPRVSERHPLVMKHHGRSRCRAPSTPAAGGDGPPPGRGEPVEAFLAVGQDSRFWRLRVTPLWGLPAARLLETGMCRVSGGTLVPEGCWAGTENWMPSNGDRVGTAWPIPPHCPAHLVILH